MEKIQIIKVEDNQIKNVSTHSSQSYLHSVKTPTAWNALKSTATQLLREIM